MATVIALVQRKGGVGKTTTAANLSRALASLGHTVRGFDCEPRQSWRRIAVAAGGELGYPVDAIAPAGLANRLPSVLERFVVVDTPGNDEGAIQRVAALADEVVVPVLLSELDALALPETLDLVAAVEQERNRPLASVLANAVETTTTLTGSLRGAFTERRIPLLDAQIPKRVAYRRISGLVGAGELEPYVSVLRELKLI